MISDEEIFTTNSKIVCRSENDQSFTVYNPNTDMITKISELSKFVLDMFDGKTAIGETYFLVSEIYGEFSTDEGKQTFLNFVQKLLDRGIIEARDIGKKKEIKTSL